MLVGTLGFFLLSLFAVFQNPGFRLEDQLSFLQPLICTPGQYDASAAAPNGKDSTRMSGAMEDSNTKALAMSYFDAWNGRQSRLLSVPAVERRPSAAFNHN